MSKIPLYFSNDLEFHIGGKENFCTDRTKIKSVLPAIVVGLLLVLLGVYEWTHGFKCSDCFIPAVDESSYKPLVAAWFFDLCFVLVGVGVITANIIRFLQYNKYLIKGSTITIVQRRIFKGKKTRNENLANYSGVRFRVEFLQAGLLTKNRYIIELYQKSADKMVPLYISTSDDNVRRKWKEYAKKFKLPAVIQTDEGTKFLDAKDMSKSIAAQYKQGLIEDNYDDYERLPKTITFVRKKDKIVIKIRKIIWDIYNIIAWFIVGFTLILFLATVGAVLNNPDKASPMLYGVMVVFLTTAAIMVQILFRKEKLVLKRNKIVHTHKYMLFSTKHNQIMKKDIEAIEVTENPATGRCFVSVISEDNTIAFGSKLALKDLRWIKRFLIHEIIK